MALLCIIAFASTLRAASPPAPIGAVVQGSHYDPSKQIVTFNLVNTSHKDITAFSLLVRANFPDGTAGIWSYGGDFLPHIAQMGTGALAPGAVFSVNVPVGQQPLQSASATVELVVYADDTADVLNQSMFNTIVAQRKGRMLGLQKANELLQLALADPNDAHPSITVAAKLKALAKQYENNPSAGEESLGLLDAATNISNAPKSAIGRSDKEDAFLRALVKTQQGRVSVMLPHTQITKVVQP
jgi:hypothetical protein